MNPAPAGESSNASNLFRPCSRHSVVFGHLVRYICAMKRLYVASEHRGRGIGRLLVVEVIRRPDRADYRWLVLDTVPEMAGAIALDRGFGLVETAPCRVFPVGRTVDMGRTLGSPEGGEAK